MSGMKVIWHAKQPKTFNRVLFRYGEGRRWSIIENWRVFVSPHKNIRYWHWAVILPFSRFTKCNGQMEIGLGNHYIELGW